jgi:hypothetical protein
MDIPTTTTNNRNVSNNWQEVNIPLDQLVPAFGGGPRSQPTADERMQFKLNVTEMGFMLSLLTSDGSPNPKKTFGEGIVPFSLMIQSIELMSSSQPATNEAE